MKNESMLESLVDAYGHFITVGNLSDIIKVHEQTIYKKIRTGKLKIPFIRIGENNAIRFNSADVAEYFSNAKSTLVVKNKAKKGRPRKVASE